MSESNDGVCRPFLATLATRRTDSVGELPGCYSSEQDVWVVSSRDGPIPIVAGPEKCSVGPVTKVKGERDELCATAVLELSTKTSVIPERDDVPSCGNSLPELVTKTDVVRERDDPSPGWILELATKTEVRRERDD
jgi:hypothetical protein